MTRAGALALLPLVLLAACGPAQQRPAPAGVRVSARSIAPLPIPTGPGNGPSIKAAACNGAGSNCAALATLATLDRASSLLNNYNALTLPAAPSGALTVPSFSLAQPLDWSNGQSNGTFPVNLATGKLLPAAASNWAVLFSGFLKVPPSASGQPVVKTFAVASDDGARFAISDGTAVQHVECNAGRSMGVSCFTVATGTYNTVLKVTFPASGGLFPFDLLWFQGVVAAGLELSWADGDQTANPPGASAGPFSLVPADALYSPDVRATLTATSSTPTVQPGSTLTWQVRIANRGTVTLSSWSFAATLPALLGAPAAVAGFPGTCSPNGAQLVCSGTQVLQPGDAASGSFTAAVVPGATAGQAIDVQGVVTGLATAVELATAVGGAGEAAAGEIFALTDDPYAGGGAAGFDTADTGNTPAGFAASAAAGNADDDPTRLIVGKPPPSPPQPAGPPDPSASDKLLAVSGTSGLPQGTAIEVKVTGPTAGAGCSTAADAAGAWSCPALALADGTYAATAAVVDAAGNRGPASAPRGFSVVPPAAPLIDVPQDGSTVNSSLALFQGGSAEPDGQKIHVAVAGPGGAAAGCDALVSGGAGAWSCTLVLVDGAWSATAAVVEVTGAPGLQARSSFTVATGAACGATLAQTPTTNQSQPLFNGTAAAGTQVTVCEGSAPCTGAAILCTVASVAAGGSWSCSPAAPLADGLHTVVAASRNGGTGQLCTTNTDVFVVDTMPPAVPGFDPPLTPTTNPAPTFTGSGEAGLRVDVHNATGGALLCSGAVDAGGAWRCAPSPLADGSYTLSAVQVDLAGNQSQPRTRPLVVDTAVPSAPLLDQPASPSPLAAVPFSGTADPGTSVRVVDMFGDTLCTTPAVTASGGFACTGTPLLDGAWQVTATARAGNGRDSPPSLQRSFLVDTRPPAAPLLDPVPSPTALHQPLFTGTAEPGSSVRIVDVTPPGPVATLCSTVSAGSFSCASAIALGLGAHSVQAQATDAAGNVSPASAVRSFVIDDAVAPAPSLDPLPAPAGGLAGFTPETRPTFGGRGVPGDTVTVRLSGGAALCTATVAGDGSWSCRAAAPLTGQPATAYQAEAVQSAPAGGLASAPSAAIGFTVDTHQPAAPLLDAPASPTSERTPLFGGTAEPLSAVEVDAAPLGPVCAATAAASGAFSCRAAAPLPDGDYAVTARATSRAGISGPDSAPPRPLTIAQVVTVPPPSIDPPRSPTPERQPVLQGAASGGANVIVHSAGGDLCTGAVAAGRWSCSPSAPLADGSYALAARAVDLGGHASADSAGVTLVVRATPPAAPVIDRPADGAELFAGASGSAEAAFAGSAEPGATVTLSLAPLAAAASAPEPGSASPAPISASAPAGVDGRWAIDPPLLLGPGSFHATASARVAPGPDYALESPASAPIALTVRAEGAVRGGCSSGPAAWLSLLGLLGARGPRRRASQQRSTQRRSAHRRSPQGRSAPRRSPPPRPGPPGRRPAPAAALLASALALAAPAARAQQQIDLGRFHPASGGDGLAATEGARPPIEGEAGLSLGLWLDGAWQPLVFVPASGGREVLVDSRVTGWLTAQARVWSSLSLAVQLPALLGQSGDLSALPAGSRPAASPGGGVGDLRLAPRLGLLRQETAPIDLAVQLALTLPTASDKALAGDGSVQAEALLAVSRRLALLGLWDLDLLGNALLRVRRAGQIGDVNTGSELGLRGGAAWIPPGASASMLRRIFLEAEALGTLRPGFSAGSLPAEWRAGLSLCAGPVSLDLAGGTALGSGVGAPRARFSFGIGLVPASCAEPERLRFLHRRAPEPLAAAPAPAPPLAAPATVPPSAPPPEVATVYIGPAPEQDSDGDGIPDSQDNCPLLPGPASLHGCPEVKTAGGELQLETVPALPPPSTLPPSSPLAQAPELPELPLLLALAPDAAAAAQAAGPAPSGPASPAAAPGPPDRDGDGIPDAEDSCPAAPGPAENHGCPAELPQAVALKGERIELAGRLEFAEGTARLDIRSHPALLQLAAVLRAHPEILKLEVQGHLDNRLPAAKARALSRARAEQVVKQLVQGGVEPSRLVARGYGAESPIAPNLSKFGRQQNQRIELRVLQRGPPAAPGKAVGS